MMSYTNICTISYPGSLFQDLLNCLCPVAVSDNFENLSPYIIDMRILHLKNKSLHCAHKYRANKHNWGERHTNYVNRIKNYDTLLSSPLLQSVCKQTFKIFSLVQDLYFCDSSKLLKYSELKNVFTVNFAKFCGIKF